MADWHRALAGLEEIAWQPCGETVPTYMNKTIFISTLTFHFTLRRMV